MINQLTKYFKIFFALSFIYLSFANLGLPVFKTEKALAADCSVPGAPVKLAIYSTDQPSPYLRPITSLDPQTVHVGQQSIRLEIELEDINGCPVNAPATVHYTVSVSDHAGDILTTGGIDKGELYNYWISTGSARAGFLVLGKSVNGTSPFTATLTAVNTDLTAYTTATQSIIFDTPAPDVTKLVFTNNPHSIPDTISGLAGAAPGATNVNVYTSDGLTLLGSVPVAVDGSFPAVVSGDDQYRQVLVKAVYTGGALSNGVLFSQNYPAVVTNLLATRDLATGRPSFSWTGDSGATFRIYRADLTIPNPIFSEANFIGTAATPSFTDTTGSYILGTKFRYVVKEVISGSYTPEFLPIVDFQADLANGQVSPASPTNTSHPTVTALVSNRLALDVAANPTALKVKFTNLSNGAIYYASPVLSGTSMSATAPYLDSSSNSLAVLPDGSYKVEVIASDVTNGISDSFTVINGYAIDTVAPVAPNLLKLRYSGGVVSGLAGAVEGGTYVDIYSQLPAPGVLPVTSVLAAADGSFTSPVLSLPAGGIFYLVSRDLAGNISLSTLFDVVTPPVAPNLSKLVMHQNNPGTADVIEGLSGAVTAGAVVRIYNVNPATTAGATPVYELIAKADGSFSQAVGDNLSAYFWVATFSGSGSLSPAVMLTNAIAIGAPTNLVATANDGSVTLSWTAVSGAAFYTVDIYDTTTNTGLPKVTLSGGQTTLVTTLSNDHTYRFAVISMDNFGNSSPASEATATPKAKKIVLSSSSSSTTPVAPAATSKKNIAQSTIQPPAPSPSPTVESPSPSPSPSPAPENPRNWTPWIIGLGILILLIALVLGYNLWIKEPSETVVATIKKPRSVATPASKSGQISSEKGSKSDGGGSVGKNGNGKTNGKDVGGDDKPKPPKPRW